MTNLWCNHVKFPGHWVIGHGYDRVSSRAFTDLTDLTAVVAASAAPGSIRQLGIIVHGDEGELKMGIDDDHQSLVTPELIAAKPDIRENLRRLGRYLHATATVSFYSCSAAASTRGSALLTSLSQFWPECTVIGSITKGYRFNSLTAGQLSDTLLTVIEHVTGTDQYFVPGQSSRPGRNQFFLPASLPRFLTVQATMKRARNGRLTHFPVGPGAFREFEMGYPRRRAR